MKKLLKSRKALSTVVTFFIIWILIAATIAVSFIFIAWWNPPLTGYPMQIEQISYTDYAWATPSGTTISNITLTIKNTGNKDLFIASITVNGTATGVTVKETNGATVTFPRYVNKGSTWSFVVSISGSFQRGTQYNFMVVTSKGNQFGPYTLTAP
jgi:hypothetical protein